MLLRSLLVAAAFAALAAAARLRPLPSPEPTPQAVLRRGAGGAARVRAGRRPPLRGCTPCILVDDVEQIETPPVTNFARPSDGTVQRRLRRLAEADSRARSVHRCGQRQFTLRADEPRQRGTGRSRPPLPPPQSTLADLKPCYVAAQEDQTEPVAVDGSGFTPTKDGRDLRRRDRRSRDADRRPRGPTVGHASTHRSSRRASGRSRCASARRRTTASSTA